MSSVIVTGASGFLGRQVVARLAARGHEVHAIARNPLPQAIAPAIWHRVDLLDAAQVAAAVQAIRAEGLVHLAWETAHGKYWSSPSNLDWTAASLQLLRHFGDCGGRRALVAGSSAEYDWSMPSPLDESRSPLRPLGLYGRCKNALREVLEAWAPGAGISWAWGRIFNMYGPFENPQRLVPRVVRALGEGRTLPFDDGGLVRDFLHIEDAGDAFAALYSSEAQGPVNIASGEAVTVREVVQAIGEAMGAAGAVGFGALPRPREAPQVVASVARLRDDVGWSPRRGLREGLCEACDWWRSDANAPVRDRFE
jgi:nucleoside-diphosphate-sugar epimerase